jgi:hypothetical protein
MSELGKIGTKIREKLGNLEKTTFYSKIKQQFYTINHLTKLMAHHYYSLLFFSKDR